MRAAAKYASQDLFCCGHVCTNGLLSPLDVQILSTNTKRLEVSFGIGGKYLEIPLDNMTEATRPSSRTLLQHASQFW